MHTGPESRAWSIPVVLPLRINEGGGGGGSATRTCPGIRPRIGTADAELMILLVSEGVTYTVSGSTYIATVLGIGLRAKRDTTAASIITPITAKVTNIIIKSGFFKSISHIPSSLSFSNNEHFCGSLIYFNTYKIIFDYDLCG